MRASYSHEYVHASALFIGEDRRESDYNEENSRLRYRRCAINPYKLLDLLTLFTSIESSYYSKKGENEATKLRFRSKDTKELKRWAWGGFGPLQNPTTLY
jgi:hypothetical protein